MSSLNLYFASVCDIFLMPKSRVTCILFFYYIHQIYNFPDNLNLINISFPIDPSVSVSFMDQGMMHQSCKHFATTQLYSCTN